MSNCNERWHCKYGENRLPLQGGYTIVPFGDHYGLWCWTEEPYELTAHFYLTTNWMPSIDCALAEAQGLPPESRFNSVEQCKELVAIFDAAMMTWVQG